MTAKIIDFQKEKSKIKAMKLFESIPLSDREREFVNLQKSVLQEMLFGEGIEIPWKNGKLLI